MFTFDRLEKLKRLFQDPEWKLIDEMLREYIEPLKDVFYVDLSDSSTSVKGELRVRKQTYQLLDKFLKDAQTIAENRKIEATDPRDSME